MEKTTEELYRERLKRVNDAIQLKIPDRVPIELAFGYFPAKYTGITCDAAYYDYDGWLTAYKKTVLDFAPDTVFFIDSFTPGTALEYLDPKSLRWPGRGVPPNHGHQAVEGEWMKADEYDLFLNDLSDYMLRVYFPRFVGAMEPLKVLPKLSSFGFGYYGLLALVETLAIPEVDNAIETMLKAGRELRKWRPKIVAFNREIEKLGFPVTIGGIAQAPFDVFSDFLRGMHGTMLDMYRQPDKLLAVCEQQLARTLQSIAATAQAGGNSRIFMALHRGSDGFMSLKQFETFYWPTLKKVIIAAVDAGLTPGIFFEGDWTARLEYLLELPKGKVLGHFDATDIFKAKEVLKNHMCIRGNVPPSLLQTGTVQEVKDYCKILIDVVGKDGGLIVCPRSSIDEVNPANLKIMIDFTKEYGVYN